MEHSGPAAPETSAGNNIIKAFIAAVRPEHLEEYRRLHAAPWPEIIARLRAANITDYHIFLDPQRHLLFARWTYVGSDLAADMLALKRDPIAESWNEATLPCLFPIGDGTDAWQAIDPIFSLE